MIITTDKNQIKAYLATLMLMKEFKHNSNFEKAAIAFAVAYIQDKENIK